MRVSFHMKIGKIFASFNFTSFYCVFIFHFIFEFCITTESINSDFWYDYGQTDG